MLLEINRVSYCQGLVRLYFLGTMIYCPHYLEPYSFNNLQLGLYYLLTKIDLKWEELFRPLE